ncbi:MAG: DUF362 domain-containing protein [Oscillospiraceae bacterium]
MIKENEVAVIYKKKSNYSKSMYFRPDKPYPEYLFKEDVSIETNDIYEMVREGLRLLKYDKENFKKPIWNPLKEIINKGDTVLIKPNLVMHRNYDPYGEECLYTNPSVLAAIIDYVLIALDNTGKIVVGDAPMQECDFETLINESGYNSLIEYYKNKGVNIELVDFRNVKTQVKNGIYYKQENNSSDNGKIVALGEFSSFSELSEERLDNLRITNYDPSILKEHHNINKHEYYVSKYVLDSDVIINMPKCKTHKKAGVTLSLKNFVGINANKEFLPHHTNGSKEEGGDAYLSKTSILKMANKLLDIKNRNENYKKYFKAKIAMFFYRACMFVNNKITHSESFFEGSWYGNDTIWRTLLDLNKIAFYADKEGNMCNQRQRNMLIVGDMIVAGEGNGPVSPSPKDVGIIGIANNPVCFDQTMSAIMGVDYSLLPTIYNARNYKGIYKISCEEEPNIISNTDLYNGKDVKEILNDKVFQFKLPSGWKDINQ